MPRKRAWFMYLLLAAFFGVVLGMLYHDWVKRRENFFSEQLERTIRSSSAIFSVYDRASSLIVTAIMQDGEVPRMLGAAWKTDDLQEREQLRNRLMAKLAPFYEEMKTCDFRQLHFHFPDNTSFLRCHRPEKFGDDLTEVRKTVARTNSLQEPTVGFEEGRIFNGYRFVYPVFFEGTHVGSVETSISLMPVAREFLSSLEHVGVSPKVLFFLKKSVVTSKVFEEYQENYVASASFPDYVIDREFLLSGDHVPEIVEEINRNISNAVRERMARGEIFALSCSLPGEGTFLVKFLPVANVEGAAVGYVVYYYKNPSFLLLKRHYIVRFVYFLLAGIGISVLVFLRHRFMNKLERLATVDPLTHAENRYSLVRHFDQTLELAKRYNHPLSVIMFDVDHFKKVNDVHGHTVGDEVLIKVVRLCGEELRGVDHLARWGGDEFFILLPETPEDGALEVAERLRRKTEAFFREAPYEVTLSMGVYEVPVDEISSADDVFARVDSALYRAKEKGRNRVEMG